MDLTSAPEVQVWIASLGEWRAHARWHEIVRSLSDGERARAGRFLREEDQERHRLGRGLLRCLLAKLLSYPAEQFRFADTFFGRPELAAPPMTRCPSFNISHADDLVVIAISNAGDVGIDVESTNRDNVSLELAAKSFSAKEQASLSAVEEQDRRVRFFELWTLKEAFIKALGTGFGTELADFTMHAPPLGAPTIEFHPETNDRPEEWHFQKWLVREYVVSAAVRSPERPTFKLKMSSTDTALIP